MRYATLLLALCFVFACTDKQDPAYGGGEGQATAETNGNDTNGTPPATTTKKPATTTKKPAPSTESNDSMSSGPAMGKPTFKAQDGWVSESPKNNMRRAQFRLPKAEGDAADAEVVVFLFPGSGGNVDANLGRWEGQFTNKTRNERSHFMVKGRRVDVIELEGSFGGGMGGQGGDGVAMVGAVIESEKDNWFVTFRGPKKTVAKWRDSFDAFLKSVY